MLKIRNKRQNKINVVVNVLDLLSSYRLEMTEGVVRLCSGDFFISLCFIIGAVCAEISVKLLVNNMRSEGVSNLELSFSMKNFKAY